MADLKEVRVLEACRRRKPLIRDGDVLFFRPTTREGRWIWRIGRTERSHGALVYWAATTFGRRRVKVLEQIQPEGREVSLAEYSLACPSGTIDVYRLRPEVACDFDGLVEWALDHGPGTPYDYAGLWRSLATHLAFWRWFVRAGADDQADGNGGLYCTAFVARAFRLGGGVDLVPNLSDRATEPGDLFRSGLLRYRFTITHSGGGAK